MREDVAGEHATFYEDGSDKCIISDEESETPASYIFAHLLNSLNDDAKQKIFDNLNKQFGTSITLEEYNDNSENIISSLNTSSEITSSLKYSITPVMSDPNVVSFTSSY